MRSFTGVRAERLSYTEGGHQYLGMVNLGFPPIKSDE